MKVIRKGKGRKMGVWSIEKECTGSGNGGGGCGAKLRVEDGDFLRTGCHSYDGSSEYFISFVCPVCKVMTDLKSGEFRGDSAKLGKGPGG